jgi:hypothetical protein
MDTAHQEQTQQILVAETSLAIQQMRHKRMRPPELVRELPHTQSRPAYRDAQSFSEFPAANRRQVL